MIRFQVPPKGSLQRRLSLTLTAVIAALWLIATLAAGLVLREEIDEVFDSALQEVAQRILPLAYIEILNRDNANPDEGRAVEIPSVAPHREYITYIVRKASGDVLMQSHDAEPATFPPVAAIGFRTIGTTRFFTESAVRGTLFVTTAERAGHRQSAVMGAALTLIWPLAILLPLSLLGIWALIDFAFRPVKIFRRAIEARGSTNLTPLEAGDLPAEILPLAQAVNALLARLRRALEAERGFAANSAHELRTPVAAALAQTQRLIAELPETASRQRAMDIEAALRRLGRLSEKLLQWARAEGAGVLAESPQDVAPILPYVLDDFRANPRDAARLVAALPASGHCSTLLDVDAFAVLARNLIENALKHGLEDQPVMISLSETGVFRVANPGPVLPHEELERLLNPFERGATPAEGAGLGLAIVRSIIESAGGTLTLSSPASGRQDGFEALVQLPQVRS